MNEDERETELGGSERRAGNRNELKSRSRESLPMQGTEGIVAVNVPMNVEPLIKAADPIRKSLSDNVGVKREATLLDWRGFWQPLY